MKPSICRKFAEEFITMLKYNPELTDDVKILALEARVKTLVDNVEQASAEAHQRREQDKVIVDTRPQDIQPIADLMIKDQARRGSIFN